MKTKYAIINFITSAFPALLIALIGVVKIKVFLNFMGGETVGIYQMFAQFYAYISLLEAGIGASALYQLYKPIKEKNTKKLNSILSAIRTYFNKVAIIMIIIGIILSFLLPNFISDLQNNRNYIQLCMIIYFVGSTISYFVYSYNLINRAEQKVYKNNIIYYVITIIKNIFEIVLICNGFNLLSLMVVHFISSLIQNIWVYFQSKKDRGKINFSKEKDYTFKKEMKNLLTARIGNLIYNNIDMILLSKYVGMITVVKYTSYYYIFNIFSIIISQIGSALIPSIGDLLIENNKEKNHQILKEFNAIIFYFSTILILPLFYFITPFVSMWYGEKYTVSNITLIFLIILFFINIIKIPLTSYMDSAGDFKTIKKCSIIESLLNLMLSIVLVQKYGIAGVAIGTIISTIIGTFIFYPNIIYKKILNRPRREYYLKIIKYITVILLNGVILYLLMQKIEISNLLNWIIYGFIIFIINFTLTTLIYWKSNELSFLERFKNIINRKEK